MKKLTFNSIQCLHCNQFLESVHVHDFKRCQCGKVAVDGGLEYARRIGQRGVDFTELSQFEGEEEDEGEPFNFEVDLTSRGEALNELYLLRAYVYANGVKGKR